MFSDAEKRRQYTEVKKKQQNFMAPFYSHFVESTLEPPSGFEHGTPDWKSSALTTRPLLHEQW